MKEEDREELEELVGLVEAMVLSENVSENSLLDVNYRLRKKIEQLLDEVEDRERAFAAYYLLGDNYSVIRKDPSKGASNLIQVLPLLQALVALR